MSPGKNSSGVIPGTQFRRLMWIKLCSRFNTGSVEIPATTQGAVIRADSEFRKNIGSRSDADVR
jgi:hypothetical protein